MRQLPARQRIPYNCKDKIVLHGGAVCILRGHLLDLVPLVTNHSLRQRLLQMVFRPIHVDYATALHDKLWDKSLWSFLDNATLKAK